MAKRCTSPSVFEHHVNFSVTGSGGDDFFFFFPRICNLLQELGGKNNILTCYYRQGREMEINLSLFVKVQDKKNPGKHCYYTGVGRIIARY